MNKNRKLNPIEKFCYNLNQNGAFNCQFEGEFIGKLSQEILFKAVTIIQKKHFFLNVSINDYLVEPEFVYNAKLEIPIIYLSNEDWLNAAEVALNKTFDSKKGPLCSIIYIENQDRFTIILTLDHTIADGISGMLLLDDLIFICDQLLLGEENYSIEQVPEVVIHSDSLPTSTLSNSLSFFSPKRPPLEGEYSAPIEERYTHILPIFLSKEFTQKLINKCKDRRVSVHAGISAILLIALAKEIKSKSLGIEPVIDLVAPVSLRKFFKSPIEDNQLGMAALQIKTQHSIYENSHVWGIAQEIYEKTQGVINNGEIFLVYKDLLALQHLPFKSTYKDHERKVPYLTFSNMGKVDFGKNLRSIKPIWVSCCAQIKNGQGMQWGLYFTGLMTTFNGQLILSLNYLQPYWDRKRAEQFKSELLLSFENIE